LSSYEEVNHAEPWTYGVRRALLLKKDLSFPRKREARSLPAEAPQERRQRAGLSAIAGAGFPLSRE
jgi:hypothetical protein